MIQSMALEFYAYALGRSTTPGTALLTPYGVDCEFRDFLVAQRLRI